MLASCRESTQAESFSKQQCAYGPCSHSAEQRAECGHVSATAEGTSFEHDGCCCNLLQNRAQATVGHVFLDLAGPSLVALKSDLPRLMGHTAGVACRPKPRMGPRACDDETT